MIYDYDIAYNGISGKSIGVDVVKRPDVPVPEDRYEEVSIPGRDGLMYVYEEVIEDIEIAVELNFLTDADKWMEQAGKIKAWLKETHGGKLVLGDDRDFFYKVKKVLLDPIIRPDWRVGKTTATFTCAGYRFLSDGEEQCTIEDAIYNPYKQCQPKYLITGEGLCTLTVNGRTMTANVGQNITIDTALKLAYRTDGTMMNTSVAGKYEDIILESGANILEITPGFDLKIIPNWRCL